MKTKNEWLDEARRFIDNYGKVSTFPEVVNECETIPCIKDAMGYASELYNYIVNVSEEKMTVKAFQDILSTLDHDTKTGEIDYHDADRMIINYCSEMFDYWIAEMKKDACLYPDVAQFVEETTRIQKFLKCAYSWKSFIRQIGNEVNKLYQKSKESGTELTNQYYIAAEYWLSVLG